MSDRKREREYRRAAREMDRQITALEKQLEAARRKVGALSDDLELPGPPLEHSRVALLRAGHDGSTAFWLGAPMLLRMRRRFEGRLSGSSFEHFLERIRETTHDSGSAEVTRDSLVWSSSEGRHPIQPHWMVRVVVAEAVSPKTPKVRKHVKYFTTLTVTDRLESLVGRLFGAFGGILGAGGFAAPVAASLAFPSLTPVFVIGWIGGVYGVSRFLFRRVARNRAKTLQQVFNALSEELESTVR